MRIEVINRPKHQFIDAGYRDKVCIGLVNLSNNYFVIRDGERNYRMVNAKQKMAEREYVETLITSYRKNGRIVHTGKI